MLTLPRPAGTLWRLVRDVVRSEIERITGPEPAYAIGGGSILAARWGHRDSFDVDLLVPTGTRIRRLAEANDPGADFERAMRARGGVPQYNDELKFWTVLFDGGKRKLDLWAAAPLYAAGQTTAAVDGRDEVVLSTTQILRGKLERALDCLPRDAYDIAKAATADPAALEQAVNGVSARHADTIAQAFHWATPAIASRSADQLHGMPEGPRIELKRLGALAAKAIHGAVYTNSRIETRDGRIHATTTARAHGDRIAVMAPDAAEHEFESRGLNAYLEAREPGADEIRAYATAAARAGRDQLILKMSGDGATAWRTAEIGFNLTPGDAAAARDGPVGRTDPNTRPRRNPHYER